MCALARPVRVEARLAWNVATAWSMRRLRSAFKSFSAGIPAINETAIVTFLARKRAYCQRLILLNAPRDQVLAKKSWQTHSVTSAPSEPDLYNELAFYTLELRDPEF